MYNLPFWIPLFLVGFPFPSCSNLKFQPFPVHQSVFFHFLSLCVFVRLTVFFSSREEHRTRTEYIRTQ